MLTNLGKDRHTSARRRFSGFTRTLCERESNTSLALEFSLLMLTRNCGDRSSQESMGEVD